MQPQIFWLFSLYMCKKQAFKSVFSQITSKHQKLETGAITWQFLLSGTKTKKIKKNSEINKHFPKSLDVREIKKSLGQNLKSCKEE
jgi:hypothetical protein